MCQDISENRKRSIRRGGGAGGEGGFVFVVIVKVSLAGRIWGAPRENHFQSLLAKGDI